MRRKDGLSKRRTRTVAHNRRLTFAQAEAIRALAAQSSGKVDAKALAQEFDCNINTVRGIVRGDLYIMPTRWERAQAEPTPAPKRYGTSKAELTCRIERSKRADRLAPVMEEAKAAFKALLAREAEGRKGGRPKLAKPGKPRLDTHRSTELADLLPYFGGTV